MPSIETITMREEGIVLHNSESFLEIASDLNHGEMGMCRVCATSTSELISVFGSKGQEVQLADKIHSYLPIMVTGDDLLPKTVCVHCIQRLEECHDFVVTCLRADTLLRDFCGFVNLTAEHNTTSEEEPQCFVTVGKSEHTDKTVQNIQYEYIHLHQETGEYQPVPPLIQYCVPDVPTRMLGTTIEGAHGLLKKSSLQAAKITNQQALVKLQSVDIQTESHVESILNLDKDLCTINGTLSEVSGLAKAKNEKFKVHKVHLANGAHSSQTLNVIKRTAPKYPRREDTCPLCNYMTINDRNKYRAHIESHLQGGSFMPPLPGSDPFDDALDCIEKKVLKHVTDYDGVWELDSSLLSPDDELHKIIEEKSSVRFSSLNEAQQDIIVSRLLKILGNDDFPVLEKPVSNQPEFTKRQFSSSEVKSLPRSITQLCNIRHKTQPALSRISEPVEIKCPQDGVLEFEVNAEKKGFQSSHEDCDFHLQLELYSEKIADSQKFNELTLKMFAEEPDSNVEYISHGKEEECMEHDISDSLASLQGNVATGPVLCTKCGKLVPNYHKLCTHMHMLSDLKCLDCGEEFNKKTQLGCHSTKHGVEKNHVCQYCGRVFRLFVTLMNHEEMHTSSITCEKCGQSFTREKFLQDHKCHLAKSEDQVSLKCRWCPRMFVRKDCLKRHEESHEGGSHLCETCGKWFKNKMSLRKHKEIHLDQYERASKRVPCELCDKTFQNLHKLRIHMYRHKGERPFPCEVCSKAFSCKQTLRQHLATHGEAQYACPHCNKRFNRKGNMRAHMNRHTQNTDVAPTFSCRTCGEKFSDRGHYTSHCITHTAHQRSLQSIDPTTCEECGLRFTNYHTYNLHLRREHMMREGWVYPCKLCPSTFSTKSNHHCHEFSHQSRRHFLCKVCNRAFITKKSLLSHKRLHRGEKPFACATCTRQFSSQHSLYQHQRNVHVTDPAHKCQICGSRFKRAAALRVHQSTHSDERPFECDVCGSTFKTKGDRHTHRKRHANAPPLPPRSYIVKPEELSSTCNMCGLAFETEEDCNAHVEQSHVLGSMQKSVEGILEVNNEISSRSVQVNEMHSVQDFIVGDENDIVIDQDYSGTIGME